MSSPNFQTHSARVVATLAFKGEEKLAINIPSTGTRAGFWTIPGCPRTLPYLDVVQAKFHRV